MHRTDILILLATGAFLIAAIAFGASIKNVASTDTQKKDGYKVATGIFSVLTVLGVAWFGYRWYKNNGSTLKVPAVLKGGQTAYQRY